MAKGLPVISGCKISLLEDVNPPYICEIENNATPMDISKIIRFYDNLCDEVDQKAVTLRIRKFAKENMDMPVVMQPILKYLCD